MATYHISQTGNDTTGTGSFGNPWKTLNKACSVATGPDTIYILDTGGVFSITSEHSFRPQGSAGNILVITNYPGHSPIFDATGGTFGNNDAVLAVDNNSHYADISGFTVRNCAQGSALGRGIEVSSSATNKANHLTFHDIIFRDIETRAFGGGGDDIELYDCEFDRCVMENENEAFGGGGGWAAVVSSFDYSDDSLPRRWNVHHCYIHDSWGEGIIALRIGDNGADGMDIHHCRIENTYSKLIYVDKAHGCDIYNNQLCFNDLTYTKNGSRADGLSWAVEGTAVHPTWGIDTINIYNNVIRGTGDGISWFPGGSGAENTYRNVKVFFNSMHSINGKGWKTLGLGVGAPSPTGCELRNNIIDGGWTINSATGWTYSHNDWIDGIPSTGTHTSSISSNPLYVSPTTNDNDPNGLELQSGSPCINTGVAVSVTTDYNEETRGNPPEMGAFEEPAPTGVRFKAMSMVR